MGLALTRAEVGRLDESRAMLDVLTARDIDALPKDASWYIALAAMAETAAATNHTKIAGLVFERLRPYSDRIAITSVNSSGPVAHHIGVAAWAAGHHDAGLSALTDAVELADRCGAPVFGARSRLALAERLATRGDVARATSLAKAAHETALAARPARRRAEGGVSGRRVIDDPDFHEHCVRHDASATPFAPPAGFEPWLPADF